MWPALRVQAEVGGEDRTMSTVQGDRARRGSRRWFLRGRRLRSLLLLAALVAALAVLAGCGSSGGDESSSASSPGTGKADRNATLTIGLRTAVTTLDPTRDGYGDTSPLRHLTNEPLVRMSHE